eukprot:2619279-Alexandrium_andersonii.AAC.1
MQMQCESEHSQRHEKSWRLSRRRSAIGCGPGRSARLVTTTCTSSAGGGPSPSTAAGEAWAALRAPEAAGRWASA